VRLHQRDVARCYAGAKLSDKRENATSRLIDGVDVVGAGSPRTSVEPFSSMVEICY
jgi:hypothetical protein